MVYIQSMPNAGHIRVSDEERERLAEELQEHMVAGRLTPEGYEQRLARERLRSHYRRHLLP